MGVIGYIFTYKNEYETNRGQEHNLSTDDVSNSGWIQCDIWLKQQQHFMEINAQWRRISPAISWSKIRHNWYHHNQYHFAVSEAWFVFHYIFTLLMYPNNNSHREQSWAFLCEQSTTYQWHSVIWVILNSFYYFFTELVYVYLCLTLPVLMPEYPKGFCVVGSSDMSYSEYIGRKALLPLIRRQCNNISMSKNYKVTIRFGTPKVNTLIVVVNTVLFATFRCKKD